MGKSLTIIAAICIAILLYFSSNIYGYFRFKSYCLNEGGLKVYEPLEKDVGWLADDENDARGAAQLKDVGFVRYTDKEDGKTYDIRYTKGNPQSSSSFEKKPADQLKPIHYIWKVSVKEVKNELRLERTSFEILSVKDNRILTRYYSFFFSKFNRENTFLDISSGVTCFSYPAKNNGEISGWLESMNKSFRK